MEPTQGPLEVYIIKTTVQDIEEKFRNVWIGGVGKEDPEFKRKVWAGTYSSLIVTRTYSLDTKSPN